MLSLGKDSDGKQLKLCIPVNDSAGLSVKKVKTLEIVKEYGNYYACFAVDAPDKPKKTIHKVIVIDPNHKNIGHGVDNKGLSVEIKNINRLIKKAQSAIDYLKSRRDLCKKKSGKVEIGNGKFYWKPSRRWMHFDKALQRAYKKKKEVMVSWV
ncbi:MAG: hypothetical protein DDT19_00752 [Syntrophomonadaceae bacterium]|nr:hypothetical protein [Bacillota bacterium]